MIDRIHADAMSLPDQVEEWQARAFEYSLAAREKVALGSEFVKNYTEKQPARALGIALGVGVFLGWLIKRR